MRSLMLQIMFDIPGEQFLIKKASYLSHKFVVGHAPFLIFSNHPNITILLLLLFLFQRKSSLLIFLQLYFCVFTYLGFCVQLVTQRIRLWGWTVTACLSVCPIKRPFHRRPNLNKPLFALTTDFYNIPMISPMQTTPNCTWTQNYYEGRSLKID